MSCLIDRFVLVLCVATALMAGCDDGDTGEDSGDAAIGGVPGGGGAASGGAGGQGAGDTGGAAGGGAGGEASGGAGGDASGGAGGEASGGAGGAGGVGGGGGGGGEAPSDAERLDGLLDEIAATTCDAIFRCCDDGSVETFFAPMAFSERLVELRDRIPPNGDVDAESCPALVADLYRVEPFGPWIDAAAAGDVTFDGAAADACFAALEGAACGDDLRAALTDSTCFAFAPPLGGDDRRSMFERTGQDGADCVGLTDGQGGVFFGTCDPTTSFCCTEDEGECRVRAPGTPGVCRPAGAEGEPCSILPVTRVCRTGLFCNDAGQCEAPAEIGSAELGEPCAESFALTAFCTDGWCDLGGSDACEPFREDGAACVFPYECAGGACDGGTCGPVTWCGGA